MYGDFVVTWCMTNGLPTIEDSVRGAVRDPASALDRGGCRCRLRERDRSITEARGVSTAVRRRSGEGPWCRRPPDDGRDARCLRRRGRYDVAMVARDSGKGPALPRRGARRARGSASRRATRPPVGGAEGGARRARCSGRQVDAAAPGEDGQARSAKLATVVSTRATTPTGTAAVGAHTNRLLTMAFRDHPHRRTGGARHRGRRGLALLRRSRPSPHSGVGLLRACEHLTA